MTNAGDHATCPRGPLFCGSFRFALLLGAACLLACGSPADPEVEAKRFCERLPAVNAGGVDTTGLSEIVWRAGFKLWWSVRGVSPVLNGGGKVMGIARRRGRSAIGRTEEGAGCGSGDAVMLGETTGSAKYDSTTDSRHAYAGSGSVLFDPVTAGWVLVPEPGSESLAVFALMALGALRRKKFCLLRFA